MLNSKDMCVCLAPFNMHYHIIIIPDRAIIEVLFQNCGNWAIYTCILRGPSGSFTKPHLSPQVLQEANKHAVKEKLPLSNASLKRQWTGKAHALSPGVKAGLWTCSSFNRCTGELQSSFLERQDWACQEEIIKELFSIHSLVTTELNIHT